MIFALFLAHLVGDFILQWDRLALWKSQRLAGVLVHGGIVTFVTWFFALPFAPGWWQGILFIGISHTLIDAFQWRVTLPIPSLLRFFLDQSLHLLVILVALSAGGYVEMGTLAFDFQSSLHSHYYLVFLLGYAFLTMPAWVLLKFVGYAIIQRTGPSFLDGRGKYLGIFERLLVVTFVILGGFFLVPLVVIPRLYVSWQGDGNRDRRTLFMFELLAGSSLAIIVGLILRQI
ncbi:MAG: DUF3307 domain-containing protein [Candidatus Promineifilaceae bacterium]|nr:DUF3307 domain-containing protein [Candidatus Promineifilaceae bacterium]